MRPWRNRHTRTFEGRVGRPVRVQVPSAAPAKPGLLTGFLYFARDLNRAGVNDSPVGCQSRERASPAGEVKSRRPHQQKSRNFNDFWAFLFADTLTRTPTSYRARMYASIFSALLFIIVLLTWASISADRQHMQRSPFPHVQSIFSFLVKKFPFVAGIGAALSKHINRETRDAQHGHRIYERRSIL